MKWLKINFGKNWWIAKHIGGGDYFTWEVRSLFGIPLTTCFFKVWGPFDSNAQALKYFEDNKELF